MLSLLYDLSERLTEIVVEITQHCVDVFCIRTIREFVQVRFGLTDTVARGLIKGDRCKECVFSIRRIWISLVCLLQQLSRICERARIVLDVQANIFVILTPIRGSVLLRF